MVTGINSADSGKMQLMMAQFYQKLNAADTDGTKGLSLDELSSVDTTKDAGQTVFLKSLTEQFNKLDTDSNGQLSISEIAKAKQPAPMGPPPGLDLNVSNKVHKAGKDNIGSIFSDLSGTFLQKLLQSYKDGSLSNLASSLSLAV